MPDISKNFDNPPVLNFPTFTNCKVAGDLGGSPVDVVISGIPFDQTTTSRPGARFGPASIRKASANLAWELRRWPWDFSVFDILSVNDCGDLSFDPTEKNQMLLQVQQHASRLLKAGNTMLTFGGDHYVSLPLLREHAKRYGTVALIHFDAHADSEREPDQYHHGTTFFHARNEGLIDPLRSVQIGIRTEYLKNDHRFTVLDAEWVMEHGVVDCLNTIKSVLKNHPAYRDI